MPTARKRALEQQIEIYFSFNQQLSESQYSLFTVIYSSLHDDGTWLTNCMRILICIGSLDMFSLNCRNWAVHSKNAKLFQIINTYFESQIFHITKNFLYMRWEKIKNKQDLWKFLSIVAFYIWFIHISKLSINWYIWRFDWLI